MFCLNYKQTRKRVLINAFTVRALRDTFSPARGAGIRLYILLIYYLLFDQVLILRKVSFISSFFFPTAYAK
jgi:hypothetical protein